MTGMAAKPTSCLRTLLAGAIDYAGMFPPAKLPPEAALKNYLKYRDHPQAWMLGGFACASANLARLAKLLHDCDPFPFHCIVIGSAAKTTEDSVVALRNDLLQAAGFLDSAPRMFSQATRFSLEFRLPTETQPDESAISILFDEINRRARELKLPLEKVFVEVPLDAMQVKIVDDVASFLEGANGFFGVKFRTGGLTPAATPSCASLAEAIIACHDAGVAWKATAGLHQPLRHFDASLKSRLHGFLNVFAAGVLAGRSKESSAESLRELLEETSADSFIFEDQSLAWRGVRIPISAVESARRDSVISFGSCSFDEPVAGLIELGLLQ